MKNSDETLISDLMSALLLIKNCPYAEGRFFTVQKETFKLRNRSALTVICCIIIHCLEVSCKEDQIKSVQRK